LRLVREETDSSEAATWTFGIPSWRDDLDRPIDLVEEVLRLHGTDRIPSATVTGPGLLAEDDPITVFHRDASSLMIGQGFNECVTYTLRSAAELQAWAAPEARQSLALANPFVEDQSHLRPTLAIGLLDTLRLNRSRGVPVERLFETGRVFLERAGQVQECVAVGFIVAEGESPAKWLKREPSDFYSAKRWVENLASIAGIELARQPLLSTPGAAPGWQTGHHARVGDMASGWSAGFGLLDLALVQSLGLSGHVYAGWFAILPEKLRGGEARRRFQPFSLFPAALRDIALVVDRAQPAGDVQKAVAKAGRTAVGNTFALERVQVFDVYAGAGVPEGRKSIAVSLTFRAADRTLTDEEVNQSFTRLQDDLAAAGYTIRR
jgi:phenylalanyl-tRNA synthetase beta chain